MEPRGNAAKNIQPQERVLLRLAGKAVGPFVLQQVEKVVRILNLYEGQYGKYQAAMVEAFQSSPARLVEAIMPVVELAVRGSEKSAAAVARIIAGPLAERLRVECTAGQYDLVKPYRARLTRLPEELPPQWAVKIVLALRTEVSDG